MKRDSKLQLHILQKLESSESHSLRHKKFAKHPSGYEDVSSPDWTDGENYNIGLMVQAGLLRSEKITDAPWFGPAPDDPYAETYIFLTLAGHDHLEASNWFLKSYKNIRSNTPTIFISVVTAILVSWAIYFFGAP